MTIPQRIGMALRNYREINGFSQEELSFRANLHRTYIGSVERGERNISVVNIIALCKALKIKPSELFKNLDEII